MKKFDMHIHSFNDDANPKGLLSSMENAGIYGGCVFSNRPKEEHSVLGTDFEERLNEVLAWTKGFEDRLFPVLWIHPFEENIIQKLHIAVDKGICAFKIICSDFFVSDKRCIAVLEEIAKLNKPVIFHTGILWDGRPTSDYNRPLHFESLLPIKGLRFSMGHCSWPWIDECIALYGKFLNALNTGDTAEMFFDLTPGTPEIYRKELLTKLYTIGYDVGNNVMFGTDSFAKNYRSEWANKWLRIDGKILDELGVSKLNREKLYYDNLLRFLGKTNVKIQKNSPDFDDSKTWSAVEPSVKSTIEKWYKKLNFPKSYDNEFYDALENISVSDAIDIESYDSDCKDGKRNLLSFLFMCENIAKYYKENNINEDILLATLDDIPSWTTTWSNVKGELYLGELNWLKHHLSGKIFRFGRLQFAMGKAEFDAPKYDLKKGENVIEIHIPKGGKLSPEECSKSLNLAKEFFAKHFPDYDYRCFTCHSWLLDETLKKYLPENSNILLFANMFTKVLKEKSSAILKYVFRWDATPENLPYMVANSEFAQKIKTAYLKGETFYETTGIIKK